MGSRPGSSRSAPDTIVRIPAGLQGRHRSSVFGRLSVAWILVLSMSNGCGESEPDQRRVRTRGVTALTLENTRPRSETRTTGVVEPYRLSQIGTEVGGVLTFVADRGVDLEGPQLDGSGGLLRDADGVAVGEGDIVATIDPTRYQEAVDAATLAIESAKKSRAARKLELDRVLSARLGNAEASLEAARAEVSASRDAVDAAEAEFDLARTTVERDRGLIESGAIAQSVLDSSESGFRTAASMLSQSRSSLDSAIQNERSALASVSEAEGNIVVQQADIATLDVQIRERENDLLQAQTDLDSCTIRAPFGGRVTDVFTAVGTYVNPGSPVLELTLLSPVKVVLTASSVQERELPLGYRVPIYVGGAGMTETGVTGTVFEKASVADDGTRTFRLGLIAPNYTLDRRVDGPDFDTPHGFFPVLPAPDAPDGDLFVNVDCVYTDAGRTFVLRLPGMNAESSGEQLDGIVIPREVEIEFGDVWRQIDAWTLRSLKSDSLGRGDALLLNPEPRDTRGVRIGAPSYLMRPGDVVSVGLDVALPPVGLWVPVSAIVKESGLVHVFVIDGELAQRTRIQVLGASGSLRRITGDALQSGVRIAVEGVAFLGDGDRVRIVEDTEEFGR